MSVLVDAHAHLDKYGEVWPAAWEEMERAGIVTLAVSMDVPSYEATREICSGKSGIVPGFGIHPWEAPAWAGRLSELRPFVDEAPMIGEVGLDRRFVEDPSAFGPQEEVFDYFLDAARRSGKLVNLHTSGAEARVAELVRRYGVHGLVHWYNGPMGPLDALVDSGAYFSVGVEVLRSDRIGKIARRIPLERLLSETDNPGGWQWLEGDLGMPSLIEQVVERLARLRGLALDEMKVVLEENARRMLADGGVPWP